MELRKVTNQTKQNYCKKEEISKKQLQETAPSKWIVASATGLVTLFYTSPKNSIYKIGVVIGCISIAHNYNYSLYYKVVNSIMDTTYYICWILGVLLAILAVNCSYNEKNNRQENVFVSFLKLLGFVGVCVICIHFLLSEFLVGAVLSIIVAWFLDKVLLNNKKKEDVEEKSISEEQRIQKEEKIKKMKDTIRKIGMCLITFIIITGMLLIYLQTDSSLFYEGGVKQDLGYDVSLLK